MYAVRTGPAIRNVLLTSMVLARSPTGTASAFLSVIVFLKMKISRKRDEKSLTSRNRRYQSLFDQFLFLCKVVVPL